MFLPKEEFNTPASDPKVLQKVLNLVDAIQSRGETGFGERIIIAFQNILGIHGNINEGEEATKFIKENPLDTKKVTDILKN
jgi:hypothetical protein